VTRKAEDMREVIREPTITSNLAWRDQRGESKLNNKTL
jgi:hypothetical protein